MANEVTLSTALQYSKSGDTIRASVSQTFDNNAGTGILNFQTIGTSSEVLDLGDVTGDKWLFVKNMSTDTDAGPTIHVGTDSPAVVGSTILRLKPKEGYPIHTADDTWYAISTAVGAQLAVMAIPFPV